jgi:hypothetical protein
MCFSLQPGEKCQSYLVVGAIGVVEFVERIVVLDFLSLCPSLSPSSERAREPEGPRACTYEYVVVCTSIEAGNGTASMPSTRECSGGLAPQCSAAGCI